MTEDRTLNISGKNIAMFCDFDGTISINDVTDLLLEKLANPDWHIIEERWEAGELDDYQCMAEQIALIDGDWQDIVKVLENVELDNGFKSFVDSCKQASIPVHIGSSGIDRVVNYFLAREGIKVNSIWAYHLVESGKGWLLKYPAEPPRTNCQFPTSLTCKCSSLASNQFTKKSNNYKIIIGDGRSDFCWSHKADFVFAKPKLAKYCSQQNIAHAPFTAFSDINQYLNSQMIFQSI